MWNTPKTWAPGETPTAGRFNLELRDNENHLKSWADLVFSVSEESPVRELAEVYRNGANLRLVAATVAFELSGAGAFEILAEAACDELASPSYIVAEAGNSAASSTGRTCYYLPLLFLVPAYHYYTVNATVSGCEASIAYWTEWNLHGG